MNRRYFKVMKEHQFLNDTSIYLVTMTDLYIVIVENEKDIPIATYSSYDDMLARLKYNKWKDILSKHKEEIFDESDLSRFEED